MSPVKIQLPASLPAELRDELEDTLLRLGPLNATPAKMDMNTLLLILAGISTAADLLTIADRLIAWRDKARRRGVNLERVVIECGETKFNLKNVDSQALVQLLEDLKVQS